MVELFQMWALVEVLGLVCLPLTITVFHNLADRGWAFSKAIGMALLAFCVWLPLMSIHILPFSQLFITGVVLVVLSVNLIAWWRVRHTIAKVVHVNIPYIIATEVIFLGMVFLLGWLRSYRPDIWSFEMYMDEGFIAAIMRSPHFPPSDMWFAGYSINYYYYAHFTIAVLAKLLGQSPSIAFNTGISTFFSLTALNLFGVTCNIVGWARSQRAASGAFVERADNTVPLLGAIPYGLLTIVMGLVLGNLAATQEWWHAHGDWTQYDWFIPSRVIDKTINEFPAFSFLLSCFHAHVLALAFTILAIGLAFNLFLAAEGKGLYVFGRGWRLPLTLGTTALILGGLFTMNGWDFPTYVGLTLICIALQQWLAYDAQLSTALLLDIFIAGASLVALSFILYIPFYFTFLSPSQGIGLVHVTDRSPLLNELLIYGLFAFLFISLLLATVSKRPFARAGTIAIFAFMGLALLTLLLIPTSATFVFASNIALFGVILLFRTIDDRSRVFTLLLGCIAFGLVAVCEVFFLKDVFAGNYPRMNTVFKFYFQAWALLSIASGAGLFFILENFLPIKAVTGFYAWIQRGVGVVWGAGLLLLLLASSVYPVTAAPARYAHVDPSTQQYYLQRTNSLDGLDYLRTDPANPGDYEAIRWLNAHVQGNPVIIEAIGKDYTNYGRISVFTGLPTLMGWVGHEYQWRVNWLNTESNTIEFERRGADVDTIYTDPSPAVVLSIMARYHAQYLYVGPLEYQKYPATDLLRFGTFMQVVYNGNGVTIYKVR